MNVEQFFFDVVNQNRDALVNYFNDDALIYWHVSNEVFNVNEYIKVNCDYPGEWIGEIETVENTPDGYVLAARVYSPDKSQNYHVVSFVKVKDEKIFRLDEYWSTDEDSPSWRKQMQIGKKIR